MLYESGRRMSSLDRYSVYKTPEGYMADTCSEAVRNFTRSLSCRRQTYATPAKKTEMSAGPSFKPSQRFQAGSVDALAVSTSCRSSSPSKDVPSRYRDATQSCLRSPESYVPVSEWQQKAEKGLVVANNQESPQLRRCFMKYA